MMIRVFFFLVFFAKSASALDGAAYLKMRKALAHVESGNDPAAQNRQTSASGKYQFMRLWDRFFTKHAGRSWSSTVPARTAPRKAKLAAHAHQDRLFDVYFRMIVKPWINRVRGAGLGFQYTDEELVAIVHRQGERQATAFLRRGYDPFEGRFGNKSLATHVAKMRRALEQQTLLVAR